MMNMYVMLMLMLWDVNACLTPRGVTGGYLDFAMPHSGRQQQG
jgi:hypothetical protein